MNPIHSAIHVDHRIATLSAQAAAERLATTQRRSHADEHATHPTLHHPHRPLGMRGTVGRFLIGLGRAIAGAGHGASARRPV